MVVMSRPKYKKCKTCGNRNHPRSGQCAWCGARLWSPIDWFTWVGILLIVLVIVGLVIYSIQTRPPSPAKLRLPGASSTEAENQ